jgi:hypothetical protein
VTVIAALDRVRGVLLREIVRAPLLGDAVRDRQRRITLRIATAILVAFALAVIAPAATLAISPIALGVPHVASSIRYLVLRQSLPRAFLVVVCVAAVAMMGLRVGEQYVGPPHAFARLEVGLATTWAIAAVCFGAATRTRLVLGLGFVACAGAIALAHPVLARLAFVHVHNLGALALWLLFTRNKRTMLVGGILVTIAFLLFGSVRPLSASALGVDLEVVGAWLVPGAAAAIAVPLVLAHVFTDSIHYAFWLGVIPEETLRHEGTLSFSMTWRALRRDFGAAGIAAVVACAAAVVAFAWFGLARARNAYFALAGFHGYIEGVMLIFWSVSRGGRCRGGSRRILFWPTRRTPS